VLAFQKVEKMVGLMAGMKAELWVGKKAELWVVRTVVLREHCSVALKVEHLVG